jgi:aquaporin rerated protein, other eukaryote
MRLLPVDRDMLKTDLQAAVLEYIGTTTFLLLFFGAIQAAATAENPVSGVTSQIELVLYISTSAGMSLLISAWLFFRVTGALFNPNVGLALVLCEIITPCRFVLYCVAEFLGGITAAGLVLALTPGPLAAKLAYP